jgi:Zn-dependent oligopeptidase
MSASIPLAVFRLENSMLEKMESLARKLPEGEFTKEVRRVIAARDLKGVLRTQKRVRERYLAEFGVSGVRFTEEVRKREALLGASVRLLEATEELLIDEGGDADEVVAEAERQVLHVANLFLVAE